ncbi:MAG: glycosyltransferase family 2 protein [Candidatus Omnitrophota bacterium]
MNKVLVSPVAFNEHIKLKSVIERFLRSPVVTQVDYLIVDDGSTDGTTQMIESFASRGVKTIRHPQRRGVGAAIRTAINYALEKHYDVLVIMAGNDKDNPDEIPQLLEPIFKEGFDFVQGSRYKKKNGAGGAMPLYRKLATRLHPLLFSLFTGKKITDSTNGFRAFRLALCKDERINLRQEWLNAYELEPYLFFKAVTLGYRVREVGVTKIYPPKKLGYTKMQPVIGWWSILRPLFYLGFRLRK